jgi:hypothetical protein
MEPTPTAQTLPPAAPPPVAPGDTWEARLHDLDVRLREWNRRCEVELEHVLREKKWKGLFRKPRPEELQSAEEEARRRSGTEILAELSALLDEICDLYAGFLPQDRAKIRARIGSAEGVFDLFWDYVEEGPSRIRGREDGAKLLRGLLAVAIDDMRADLASVDCVVGRLLVAAEGAGVDWRPVLAQAARLANLGAGGGGTCMRKHLEEFPISTYFRSTVAPALREAARSALSLPR